MTRREDARLVSGHGCFVDDLAPPGLLHMAVVYSPHAHARVLGVSTARARAAPGVLAVLTAAEATADALKELGPLFMPKDMGGPHLHRLTVPVLAADYVRFVGDRVAVVIGETLAQSRDAADLVEVEYEPLRAVTTIEDAFDAQQPIWPQFPGNVAYTWRIGDEQAAERAFAIAAHRVRVDVTNQRIAVMPIEPRAVIASPDASGERLELYLSSQSPHTARRAIAECLNMPETAVRVIAPDVGGGFGLKGNIHPEDALAAWAARRCKRPVKWVATRSESFAGDRQARDQVCVLEGAFDPEGRLLAIRSRASHALGAYLAGAFPAVSNFSLRLLPNVYDCHVVDASVTAVITNTSPAASYRGPGRAEAIYGIERLMDVAADRLGISPLEVRRRNLIPKAAMPYKSATGLVYDSGDFPAIFAMAVSKSRWESYPAREEQSRLKGRLRGRAFTCYVELSGIFNEQMGLRFNPDGSLSIIAGTCSHGQGHETIFPELVAEWLGLPAEKVHFVQGDTDKVPFGRGTFAARSAMIGGSALRVATDRVVARAQILAARLLEVNPQDLAFAHGRFEVIGTDHAISLVEIVRASFTPIAADLGIGLDATGDFTPKTPSFPNGCHVCELEVDPETGSVDLDTYVMVDDVGRVLNGAICDGQLHGGLAQGIGQAVMEAVLYDRETGQLITGSFQDYAVPRADDMPKIRTDFLNTPSQTNPLGVKGVGESGTVAAPPTVMNAILDALRPLGVLHLDMPATPSKIWYAIQHAGSGAS